MIATTYSIRHLRNAHGSKRSDPPRHLVFVIVPLLREQERLEDLLSQFKRFMDSNEWLRLVLVTTERENIEHIGSGPQTSELISRSNVFAAMGDRGIHLHFPENNNTIAEQLNFAIGELTRARLRPSDYVLIYNADSRVESVAISMVAEMVSRGLPAGQQSSLFLKNFVELVNGRHLIAAGDALFQSRWTLEREIPRYLIASHQITFIPRFARRLWMINCVGHGLLLRGDVLEQLGRIPLVRFGLEDSALGFRLRSASVELFPVGRLENADAANSVYALIRQKRTWIRGPLCSVEYLRLTRPHRSLRDVCLALQGTYNGVKWALGGLFLVGYVVSSAYTGSLALSLLLYAMYCWIPAAMLIAFWRTLPQKMFPRPRLGQLWPVLVAYPLVPIVHGFSGLLGAVDLLRQYLRQSAFRQTKTETVQ